MYYFCYFFIIVKTMVSCQGLFNNYITLSCFYAKFCWLISRVQLSFQPLSVNFIRRLTDSIGDTAAPVRIKSTQAPMGHRDSAPSNFATLRNNRMISEINFRLFSSFNIRREIHHISTNFLLIIDLLKKRMLPADTVSGMSRKRTPFVPSPWRSG